MQMCAFFLGGPGGREWRPVGAQGEEGVLGQPKAQALPPVSAEGKPHFQKGVRETINSRAAWFLGRETDV